MLFLVEIPRNQCTSIAAFVSAKPAVGAEIGVVGGIAFAAVEDGHDCTRFRVRKRCSQFCIVSRCREEAGSEGAIFLDDICAYLSKSRGLYFL